MPRLPTLIAAALCLFPLTGCTVLGGYIGALRDADSERVLSVPPGRADSLSKGTTVYATVPNRKTVKGTNRGVTDSAGIRLLRVRAGDRDESIPLDSITDLAAETDRHKHLRRGLVIGAAIDVVLMAASAWLVFDILEHNILLKPGQ